MLQQEKISQRLNNFSPLTKMEFKHISNTELLSRMEKLVRSERKITHLVLLHVSEVESRKLYADLGYDSMYSYLTRGLGYSESSAYRRLQSARFLKQLPETTGTEVAEQLEKGRLNLTQLSQMQKSMKESQKQGQTFSPEQTLELLNKLENQNAFNTEKILAQELNLPIQAQDKIRPQQDDSVRLEVTLTQEQFKELEQAKYLLSHICPEGSWAEVIAVLAQKYTQKKLGRQSTKPAAPKAVKSETPKTTKPSASKSANSEGPVPSTGALSQNTKTSLENSASAMQNPEPVKQLIETRRKKLEFTTLTLEPTTHSNTAKRKHISVHTKRLLLMKAQHRCQYENAKTGRRCESRYQLEQEHCQPLALGGSHEVSNLRILCRTHNALAARRAGLRRP